MPPAPSPSNSFPVSGLFVRALPLLAFALVIGHYIWFVDRHAINVPFQDDIYDFLRVVNLVENANSCKGAFEEWFRQYNDHRTAATRLVVYGAYLAQGEVNFHTLTLLADLALPLILFLFYFSVRGEKYRWSYLLVSSLLLLNLRAHTLVLHSQAAFAFYYVVFYSFAGLFVLHNVNVLKFVCAAILCTLATFTLASGQIAWLLGFASLLHQCLLLKRKSFMYPVMWVLVAIAMLMAWRIGFIEHADILPAEKAGWWADMLIDPPLHQAVVRYASWFLVTLGCAFIDTSTLGAGAVGVVMLAVLSFITVRCYKHEDIRLVLCCWFVVASAAAVSVGRGWIKMPDVILHERYSFFSVLLMCLLVLLIQVRITAYQRSAACMLVLLAGMYSVWTYSHFEGPLQYILNVRYIDYNKGQFPVFGKSGRESTAIVEEAIATGIYRPPCKPLPVCEIPPGRRE